MKLRGNRFGGRYSERLILERLSVIATSAGLSSGRRIYVSQTGRGIELFSGFLSFLKIAVRLYRYRSIPRFYLSSCGASNIVIKNNVIAFYIEKNVVIKLFGNGLAYARHLEGVEKFSDCLASHVKIPQVIMQGAEPACYVVESLQGGSRLSRPLRLTIEEVGDLVRFHMSSVQVAVSCIPSKLLVANSEAFLEPFCSEARVVLGGVSERSVYTSMYGATHGDLTVGNMLRQEENLVLFDWEGYSEQPIASDLVTIWLQSDAETRELIVTEYNIAQQLRFVHESLGLRPENMAICLLFALVTKFSDTCGLYKYLLNRDGSIEDARAGVAKSQGEVIEGINFLCTLGRERQWFSDFLSAPYNLSASSVIDMPELS